MEYFIYSNNYVKQKKNNTKTEFIFNIQVIGTMLLTRTK